MPITMTCYIEERHGTMLLVAEEKESEDGPRVEVYQCERGDCGRRVAVVYEPAGGMSEEQQSWVEREVARHGAFFPSDYRGGGSGGGFPR